MTNSAVDRLVDQYLTRLYDAALALPPDRRDELLSEIREHIVASRAERDGDNEAAVRTMLDRLGEPADIVAAAAEDDQSERPAYPEQIQTPQRGIGLEIAAVVMLTLGSLIPVFGWAVGVVLLWSSGLWRRSEKVLGTLIFPGGPGLALFLGAAAVALPQALGIATLLFVLLGPFVVAIVLLSRARGRVAPKQHHAAVVNPSHGPR
jgi:uncharacterized membrane protein